jgi:hypothetical protein
MTCSWLLLCTTTVLGIWAWFDLKERRHKKRLVRQLDNLTNYLKQVLEARRVGS